jgi:hypothetical protein
MSGNFSVGLSSYGDLRGVEQFVASERMALQILSVKVDFDQWKADQGSGDRLSINEAKRSRARQSYLWANRVTLGVTVAAPFTSRHDEVAHGNAIDIGVTTASGGNRALTSDEFTRVHGWVEQRGGTWTGVNFGEPWHHEMATRTEQLPPYPNARALVAAGPHIKSKTPNPTPPAPVPATSKIGDDMVIVTVTGKTGEALAGDIDVFDGLRAAVHTTTFDEVYDIGRSEGVLRPEDTTDVKARERLRTLGFEISPGQAKRRLTFIRKAGGYVDPYFDGKF